MTVLWRSSGVRSSVLRSDLNRAAGWRTLHVTVHSDSLETASPRLITFSTLQGDCPRGRGNMVHQRVLLGCSAAVAAGLGAGLLIR